MTRLRRLMEAAYVIARRDFSAVIFSKTFILFLLGPLLPVIFGLAFGAVGSRLANNGGPPIVGVILPADEATAIEAARKRMQDGMSQRALPLLKPVEGSPREALANPQSGAVVILSGSLERPVLTGQSADADQLEPKLKLMIAAARAGPALPDIALKREIVASSRQGADESRLTLARGAQLLLFLLTMLLAGMVLSNMVEEKTNKIIEILAAAVPIDAVFLGKLAAMLAMSLVGIACWGTAAALAVGMFGGMQALPTPAVGWPVFALLILLYFSTAYTLLGAMFIGIGAQASTVREVQTLSMPVSMGQIVVFFLASYAVDRMGSAPEIVAAIFPLSSPFAMIARAAQSPALWPHALALVWQILWVSLFVRIGVRLFRRTVLKSGGGRRWFRRRSADAA